MSRLFVFCNLFGKVSNNYLHHGWLLAYRIENFLLNCCVRQIPNTAIVEQNRLNIFPGFLSGGGGGGGGGVDRRTPLEESLNGSSHLLIFIIHSVKRLTVGA